MISDHAWLEPFPEWRLRVCAAFSTRALAPHAPSLADFENEPLSPYAGLNLSYRSGDRIETVDEHWRRVRMHWDLAGKPLVMPKLVHGENLADGDAALPAHPSAGWPETMLQPENADAVFSRSTQRIMAVTMADCLAALIFDPNRNTIAAVHAGWRGTRAGILGKVLANLQSRGALDPSGSFIAFGPCLRLESLAIGEDVAETLDPAYVSRIHGRPHFDMVSSNRDQAIAAGVPASNIRDLGGCSLTEPQRFFSFRRDGKESGRMAAFISLR